MRHYPLFFISAVLLFFSLIPRSFAASADQWHETATFLKERFPAVYQKVGTVGEINRDRVIFRPIAETDPPARGRELLITSNDNNPLYLQNPSALIKVAAVFDGKVLTRHLMSLGNDPVRGDNVVIPASPTIYLYCNARAKNAWPPYQHLLDSLLAADFEVVELNEARIPQARQRYGVLVRLELTGETVLCKVESIYSGNTLYSETRKSEGPVETIRAAEQTVELVQTREEVVQAGAFKATEPETSQPYSARKMSPAAKKKYRLGEKEYQRMVFCDLDGDNTDEIALLKSEGVDFYRMEKDGLAFVDQYYFDQEMIPVHLHAADLDNDGGDELLISLGRQVKYADGKDNELASLVLTWEKDRIFPLATDLPWYLRTIEDREGKKVVLGQTREPYDQYNGPIFRLRYDRAGVTVEKGEIYEPAAEIYSIYQFNLHPEDEEKVIIIEPSSEVYGYYTPEEKVYAYSPRKYGPYRETAYPKKIAEKKFDRGGFEDKGFEMVFTARRFLLKHRFDRQCFLINKERRGKANIVDESISRLLHKKGDGEDSIVGLTWPVEGLVESYESKPVNRDIIDFGFRKDTGYLLTRDNHGDYAIEAFR